MTRHHSHHHSHHKSHSSSGSGSTQSSDTYGCWKGTPTSYTAQTLEQNRSPHLTLKFNRGSSNGGTFEAEINVASTTSETQLVYWLQRNWTHPLTQTLSSLSNGFNAAQSTDGTGLSLDFLRTKPALVDFSAGQLVQDSDPSSPSTDILTDLEPIIQSAISTKADVYVFGRDYKTGIDDVHMNQGNTGSYENSIGKDGGLVFHFTGTDDHWESIFLAFAEQEIPTDDQTGAPAQGAKALSSIVMGSAGGSGSGSGAAGSQ